MADFTSTLSQAVAAYRGQGGARPTAQTVLTLLDPEDGALG